jgi:hypothetical protein
VKAIFRGLAVIFIALSCSHAANADEFYYVELGSRPTASEAEQYWSELKATKAASALEGLEYRARAVYVAKKRVETRVQAGPIEDKREARKICQALFKLQVSCFVVEGELAKAENKSHVEETLPWLLEPVRPIVVTQETAPVVQEEGEGFMPWLFGSGKENSQNVSDAKVEVAEAIRVPLTNTPDNTSRPVEVTPIVESPVAITSNSVTPLDEQGKPVVETPGWLIITRFADEDDATLFWQAVRDKVPNQAAGLRVKTIRSLSRKGGTSLNIGPFGSEHDALEFCRNGVLPINGELSCRFSSAEQLNRDRMHRRDEGMEERYRNRRSDGEDEVQRKIYWVQIAAATDQMEAMQKWESIQQKHPELLERVRGSVFAADGNNAGFVVRLGPLKTISEASNLCSKLQQSDVFCTVYRGL